MEISIKIIGDRVVCKQDGRAALSSSLSDFLAALLERSDHMLLPEAIPEGVVFVRRRGDAVVLVIEEKPQLRTVRWLSDESPVPYGKGAVYRAARLAFPFVVIVVALRGGAITGYQQCFYRTSSLQRLDEPLSLPNLYNVAEAYGLKAWLCLASLRKNLAPLSWEEKVREIRKHLWGAAFNRSSEVHEGNSYWQTMRNIDRRVRSLDGWEEESKKAPFFPLEVKWPPAGKTVGQVMDEMLSALSPLQFPSSAFELAQLLNLPSRNGRRMSWLFPFRK